MIIFIINKLEKDIKNCLNINISFIFREFLLFKINSIIVPISFSSDNDILYISLPCEIFCFISFPILFIFSSIIISLFFFYFKYISLNMEFFVFLLYKNNKKLFLLFI